MSRILLIDAYSQIYRVFYAIRMLTDSSGAPANAIYGMARLFMQLDEEYPSEYGAIVFDLGKCTRRTALLPEYKAQRPPMPPELRCQTEAIRQWAEAFGWNVVMQEGVEADDLISGIAAQRGDADVLILSSDKDLAQLCADPRVKMLSRKSGGEPWKIEGAEAVRAHFGVPPEQLRDYLALIGDSADNIPGVPGCGPKTAAGLLEQYGSIEAIMGHLEELKGAKLRENLRAAEKRLQDNCSLVNLDRILPENWRGLPGIARRTPDWDKILAMCGERGFKSIAEAVKRRAPRPMQQGLLEFL
ncbi:MAG: hypothetical protein J6S21_02375 [Victivallales bacterium]|nr:hypothetical protein [Victivallales bacterium]